MSSEKKIEANRRNAQLSTGPRSPEGIAVRFMARNTADAIEIQIIDAAPAMDEKVRTQLFDRFKDMTAMQSASVEERMGSGLALPIARKIIESHSGTQFDSLVVRLFLSQMKRAKPVSSGA